MLDKSQLSEPIEFSTKVIPAEIARFDALAQEWWDPNGQYKTALAFNQARLAIMIPLIEQQLGSLEELTVLDIGCGGGLIAEPLAKRGAQVTGIDASATSIEVAKEHAKQQGVDVNYRHCLAETVLSEGKQFDLVVNAEVVEHVHDQQLLVEESCQLVNTNGMLILATLNRTWLSYLVAILGAEYVLRLLPIGTHDWKKFVQPEELLAFTAHFGFEEVHRSGLTLNPITGRWRQTRSTAVNYILGLKNHS